jgi:hypothetical protein
MMLKRDGRCKPCRWNDIPFDSVTDCAAFNKITVNEQIRRFQLGYASDADMIRNMAHLRQQAYFVRRKDD